jgi:altronate dehydratase large subunit
MAHLVISPGNTEGGLSSIAEKSLGCIRKGGTSPIREVVEYAETPQEKGLVVMNTPGSDVFSITGKIAAGAQMVLFTTGRGSPAGSAIAPVVKISSTTRLYEQMPSDMDFDAGRLAAGVSLAKIGAELAGFVVDVASGQPTKAELTRTELFAIHTQGAAF